MRFFVDTSQRTKKEELMDDFSLSGLPLRDTLNKLATINKWLGGNKVTLNGLKKILKTQVKSRELTIVDLGCGGGDLIRRVATFGRQQGYTFKLIGLDANKDAIEYARSLSGAYPEISFKHQNIFSDDFEKLEYDILLSTLFLHHFKEQEIIGFLKKAIKKVRLAIIINDLHRHRLAYYLFKLISLGFNNNMIRQDGLVSILRGFKRKEIEKISTNFKTKSKVLWKWAFRYQWILYK